MTYEKIFRFIFTLKDLKLSSFPGVDSKYIIENIERILDTKSQSLSLCVWEYVVYSITQEQLIELDKYVNLTYDILYSPTETEDSEEVTLHYNPATGLLSMPNKPSTYIEQGLDKYALYLYLNNYKVFLFSKTKNS